MHYRNIRHIRTFIDADYGTTIKNFRKKHKLTHEKFGELIGMNPKISARWENGKSVPTRESYKKIMELFMKCG